MSVRCFSVDVQYLCFFDCQVDIDACFYSTCALLCALLLLLLLLLLLCVCVCVCVCVCMCVCVRVCECVCVCVFSCNLPPALLAE